MNIFATIFTALVVVDIVVPGVNVSGGWYLLWGALAVFCHSGK